jgi:hypothetical protein
MQMSFPRGKSQQNDRIKNCSKESENGKKGKFACSRCAKSVTLNKDKEVF